MTPSSAPGATEGASRSASELDLSVLARENLVAWCIVPYDSRRRGPRARAEMLARLGITRLAWDWRPEHVSQLDAELDALDEFGIELTGVWLPASLPADDGVLGRLDPDVGVILDTLRDRGAATQLWTCTEFGQPGPVTPLPADEHRRAVERTAAHLGPLAERANADGHTLALYNHLGWAGEPANQLDVLRVLLDRGLARPGLVYVQHHGHAHLDRFASILDSMGGALVALGINGMLPGAHWGDGKVHPVGRGPRDLELARTIATSGWRGPVAILGHTMDDVEDRLLDNLEGLDWIVERLRQEADGEAHDDAPSAGDAQVRHVAPSARDTPSAPVVAGALPSPPAARIPHPRWPHELPG